MNALTFCCTAGNPGGTIREEEQRLGGVPASPDRPVSAGHVTLQLGFVLFSSKRAASVQEKQVQIRYLAFHR